MEFQGAHKKLRKKQRFLGGIDAKKWKIPGGVTVTLTGTTGWSTSQKFISSTGEGAGGLKSPIRN